MKEIEFVLKLQWDNLTVLCSIFEKPVTPRMKNIAIKYHDFRSFVANGDVDIKQVDTKDQIADIFTKPLDYELFGYLRYTINGW